MVKVKLIGLSGKKRSGKDTVYHQMIKLGAPALRIGFADALKDELAWACNVTRDFVEENKAAFRLGLQWWGTEFRRGLCGDDYWIEKMDEQVAEMTGLLKTLASPMAYVVLTDVRFPNEYDYVHNSEGSMIRVNRDPGSVICEFAPRDEHPSETALDNHTFDYVIDNNGPIDHLESEVKRILEDIENA